jgi:hypothetical protein
VENPVPEIVTVVPAAPCVGDIPDIATGLLPGIFFPKLKAPGFFIQEKVQQRTAAVLNRSLIFIDTVIAI